MPQQRPSLTLIATPSNRRAIVEAAREAERRGWEGIYVPSRHSNMSVCDALAWNTDRIRFGTAIAPIYARSVADFAEATAFIHEVSGGRFLFGIGVAHAPGHARLEARVGKPLAEYMGDIVLEIDVLPNMARCLSMIGMAREVAALTGSRLKLPDRVAEAGPGSGDGLSAIEGLPRWRIDAFGGAFGLLLPALVPVPLGVALAARLAALAGLALRLHVDGALEAAALVEGHSRGADVAHHPSRGSNDDVLRGQQIAAHLALDDDRAGAHLALDAALAADGDLVGGELDLAAEAALDEQVLLAGELALPGE